MMSFEHRIFGVTGDADENDDRRFADVTSVEMLDDLNEVATQLTDDARHLHKVFPADKKQLEQFASQFFNSDDAMQPGNMQRHVEGRMQECLNQIRTQTAMERRTRRLKMLSAIASVALVVGLVFASAQFLQPKPSAPDALLPAQSEFGAGDATDASSNVGATAPLGLLAVESEWKNEVETTLTDEFSDEDDEFVFQVDDDQLRRDQLNGDQLNGELLYYGNMPFLTEIPDESILLSQKATEDSDNPTAVDSSEIPENEFIIPMRLNPIATEQASTEPGNPNPSGNLLTPEFAAEQRPSVVPPQKVDGSYGSTNHTFNSWMGRNVSESPIPLDFAHRNRGGKAAIPLQAVNTSDSMPPDAKFRSPARRGSIGKPGMQNQFETFRIEKDGSITIGF